MFPQSKKIEPKAQQQPQPPQPDPDQPDQAQAEKRLARVKTDERVGRLDVRCERRAGT